jgi:hypothetical protein
MSEVTVSEVVELQSVGENPSVDALAHARAHAQEEDLEDEARLAQLQPWKRAFILELRKAPNVDKARKAGTKLSRQTIYNHRDSDELFRTLWDEAMEGHIDAAEETVFEMGTVGDVRRTFRDGEMVSEEYRRSSDALKFYLSANRAKYRENKAGLQINISTGPTLADFIRGRLDEQNGRKLDERSPIDVEAQTVKS